MRKYIFVFCTFIFSVSCFSQKQDDSLIISSLTENVWNYEAWASFDGHYFPSNGLVIKTDSGLVLVDTPVNDSLTQQLLNYFPNEKIALSRITHFHNDRIGGIKTLLNNGIKVISHSKTAELAEKDSYPKPSVTFKGNDTIIKTGNTSFELYYPDWGHTIDNIVIWLPLQNVLYGGCFIKSKESKTLDNIKDANVKKWLIAAKKVEKKFSEARIVVPGHGDIGNKTLIKKTIRLIKKSKT
ncbi:MAG: subclass B1 metallo-beta-lactamase [Bacteroidota bacterium]